MQLLRSVTGASRADDPQRQCDPKPERRAQRGTGNEPGERNRLFVMLRHLDMMPCIGCKLGHFWPSHSHVSAIVVPSGRIPELDVCTRPSFRAGLKYLHFDTALLWKRTPVGCPTGLENQVSPGRDSLGAEGGSATGGGFLRKGIGDLGYRSSGNRAEARHFGLGDTQRRHENDDAAERA